MKLRVESYVTVGLAAGFAAALLGLARLVQMVDDAQDVEPDPPD